MPGVAAHKNNTTPRLLYGIDGITRHANLRSSCSIERKSGNLLSRTNFASVMEQADSFDLKPKAERRGSPNLPRGTNFYLILEFWLRGRLEKATVS